MGDARFWLFKCEPTAQSIDDLAAMEDQKVAWFGVRNYQARNYMRDSMQQGDLGFYYHSACPQPGIVGMVRVASKPYPDPTQFDPSSPYFDPKASQALPRWILVDVQFVKKTELLSLAQLRAHPNLASMHILQRGSRLSITPVSQDEWQIITPLLHQTDV